MVTKREIMFSVIIALLLFTLGFFISGKIENSLLEEQEMYYKALRIENNEQFDYSLKTNVGNSLLFGTAIAEGSVSIPELQGEYSIIVRHAERYTEHVTYETEKDANGNEVRVRKVTYSWDNYGSDHYSVDSFTYMGYSFTKDFFDLGSGSRISLNSSTVSDEYRNDIKGNHLYEDGRFFERVGDIRYYYTGYPLEFTGTMFTVLKDNNVSEKTSEFYYGRNIADVLESKENSLVVGQVGFWIIWVILIVVAVIGFCYIDNHWLEDRRRYSSRY